MNDLSVFTLGFSNKTSNSNPIHIYIYFLMAQLTLSHIIKYMFMEKNLIARTKVYGLFHHTFLYC